MKPSAIAGRNGTPSLFIASQTPIQTSVELEPNQNKTAAQWGGGLPISEAFRALLLRRAGADLLLLARILDVVDLAKLLLMQLAVLALHDFDQILVHHD